MKKIIALVILFGLLLSSVAYASIDNNVSVIINGKQVIFTQDLGYPFIDTNNRTQVPLRATMEQFGAAISWDSASRIAVVEKNGIVVKVPVGKSYIYRNNVLINNDTVAVIRDGRTYLPIRVVLEAFQALVTWNQTTRQVSVVEYPKGHLELSFDFKWQEKASSQYAVWIEDEKRNLIKTVFATDFTKSGGYTFREDSLPLWVAKSGLANMGQKEIDAVSGATPGNGSLTYTWDGTDKYGYTVKAGKYSFYLEGTLFWTERILCSGTVTLGGGQQNNILVAIEYINDVNVNKDMIQNVKARYVFD